MNAANTSRTSRTKAQSASGAQTAAAEDAGVRVLKKYPNRRYYDTTQSRHITLDEIYAMIRGGVDVHVTDSKTGEDITAKVLAQIILEHDPP